MDRLVLLLENKGAITLRVLSIPAGGTFELIKEYQIHSFPNPRSYDFSGLVTFRKKGGIMESLYSVQQTIVIDVHHKDWLEDIKVLDRNIQDRIKGYIEERKRNFGFSKPNFMFWILSKEKDLLHEPHPVQNYNNHVYFMYEEICSGEKIVAIDSKKKR